MPSIEKVAIIGLDCAEPSLVFERWIEDLPNLGRLCRQGTYGELESCMPPITVPAWSCMASSKDPGTLGIYGFRNRADYSYDKMTIATSLAVRERRVWDYLDGRGQSSIVLGVPGTYPISRPVRGCMICGFLAPDTHCDYTHPKELKQEIAELVGEYMLDVKGFRTEDKKWLLDQIYDMTVKRFKVARHLIRTKPWDLFWMVEMGTDRIHHGFWQFMDPAHHRYEPGNALEHAIHDYYVYLDGLIGELLSELDLEKTAVLVVSDHGAKCMRGGFCFNDWLIREGYLVMKNPPQPDPPQPPLGKGGSKEGGLGKGGIEERTLGKGGSENSVKGGSEGALRKFQVNEVDWSKTRVWGEGGYYGRCFINVQGREPHGIVPQGERESLRDELIAKLEALADDRGQPMGTRAYKPQEIYRKVNGVAPDLVVIFGDLSWRSVGTIGNSSLYVFDNDTGPDDANHAQQGMYILAHSSLPAQGRRQASLYDVAPTCLKLLGHAIPPDMRGVSLV